jgi:ABC-type lipoprotein export system ATPase subunit
VGRCGRNSAYDTPTSGALRIDGRAVASMMSDERARLRNQSIGFVFQQFNLMARMTALENVMLPLTPVSECRTGH